MWPGHKVNVNMKLQISISQFLYQIHRLYMNFPGFNLSGLSCISLGFFTMAFGLF